MFDDATTTEGSTGKIYDAIDFTSLSTEQLLEIGKLKFNSWKNVTEEYLGMLVPMRTKLRGKGGDGKWAAFVRDLNGPSLKTLNTHLDRFVENGNKKPSKLIVKTTFDPNKVVVRNVRRDRDAISFDVYLPEFQKTYTRTIRT
jgi:hypothetical protein